MTRDELIRTIDSPTVAALEDVFNGPQLFSKSYGERIVDILAERFPTPAQAVPMSLSDFSDAQIAAEHYWRAQKFLGDPRVCVTLGIAPTSPAPSTDEKSPVLNWKLDRPECPRCRGHGRVGIMACNDCGATGVVVSSTEGE